MIKLLLILLLGFSALNYAQDSYNVIKKYQWNGEDVTINNSGDKYSDVWGFKKDNRDYGFIGSTMGVHIFDVTDVNNCKNLFFVPGRESGVSVSHRDYHDYKGYLYMVSDEGNASLQILNLNNLPNSVNLVYDSDSLFSTAHNVFIDSLSGRMYVCGGENKFSIYSLADPTKPSLLTICYLDIPWWSTAISPSRQGSVHDVFVKNDTAYCHTYNGMYIIDFTNYLNPIVLAAYTSYPNQGLNHSGWLKPNSPYYFTTDETQGKKIKILDISTPQDVQFIDTIGSNVNNQSIAHNPIVMGDYLYVSYYHDGLRIFNIKNPKKACQIGFFDTSTESEYNRYKGAWGVYPFLGTDKILVSDMQNGFFVLDASNIDKNVSFEEPIVYPNPFDKDITIKGLPFIYSRYSIEITRLDGTKVMETSVQNNFIKSIKINLPPNLSKGIYVLKVFSGTFAKAKVLAKY